MASMSASSVTHPSNRSWTVATGTAERFQILSNCSILRKFSGRSFLIPGTSWAQIVTSNSRRTASPPSSETLIPCTNVGLPSASTSWMMSSTRELRLNFTPRSSRYARIGPDTNRSGEPSHMRSTDASERTANNWKMVSMQRAEMLSQSMNPSAYAIGSHRRSMEPREPPKERNHSEKEMSSRSRTMSIPPSKSTSARTIGEVPSRIAFMSLS
mmetsp:Transcript_33553/g.79405  ORF Transcript_33553/g.79405 Transcript_33553/m.79405 type:complete len:213 (-) Transcript_33553:761-1399(-)